MINLQLFKKGNGGTQVITQAASVPEPTPEEKERSRMMNEYIRQTMPTALNIQSKGAEMLLGNPGVATVDYNQLGQNAAQSATQLANDVTGLRNAGANGTQAFTGAFLDNANVTNKMLDNVRSLSNQSNNQLQSDINKLSRQANNQTDALVGAYGVNANAINNALGNNMNAQLGLANKTANELGSVGVKYTNDNTDLVNQLNKATTMANGQAAQAYQNYGQTANNTANTLDRYQNGEQNNAFVDNKKQVLEQQLRRTMGDAISKLAQRGVINSSVANKTFDDISENVSDSLNRSFNNDLAMQSALANQSNQVRQQGQQLQDGASNRQLANTDNYVNRAATLQGNMYNTLANNVMQRYGVLNQGLGNSANLIGQMGNNSSNALGAQANLLNANLGNQGNYANARNASNNQNIATQSGLIGQMGSNSSNALGQSANMFNQNLSNQANLINQASSMNLGAMHALNAAQNASIDIPGKLFALATGQAAPNTDAWQTLINNRYRMANPENVSAVRNGEGGSFMGNLLGAGITAFCVVGDTLIDTPYGEKQIMDIEKGDIVYNSDHEEVEVIETLKPHKEYVYEVVTQQKTIIATESQPLETDEGFIPISDLVEGEMINTVDGYEEVMAIYPIGREMIYDIKVYGNNPTYIGNGIIVKAGTNEWA